MNTLLDYFISPLTVIYLCAGLIIIFFYLKYMWAVLQKASRERFEAPSDEEDNYGHSFRGAMFALVMCIILVAAYGWTPYMLYLGPTLCLLTPAAICYCFKEELKD